MHCNGNIIAVSAGGEAFYLDDRSDQLGDINHWIYMESNHVEGLQSGGDNNVMGGCGSSILHPCLHDSCIHPRPDSLVF